MMEMMRCRHISIALGKGAPIRGFAQSKRCLPKFAYLSGSKTPLVSPTHERRIDASIFNLPRHCDKLARLSLMG